MTSNCVVDSQNFKDTEDFKFQKKTDVKELRKCVLDLLKKEYAEIDPCDLEILRTRLVRQLDSSLYDQQLFLAKKQKVSRPDIGETEQATLIENFKVRKGTSPPFEEIQKQMAF